MKITTPLAAALALIPLAASADETFRCGRWVVSSSMTLAELTTKCGAPSSKQSTTQDVMGPSQHNNGYRRKVGETVTEKWTYDRGTRAQAMVVTIIDGRIKSLERQQ